MREITYRDLMKNDLQKMRDWRSAIEQQTEELETLEAEFATIKATDYDKMPSGSGENIQEEKMLTAIAKKDQKQRELDFTKRRLADMERLLSQLSDEERMIIERTVINRENYDTIAEELHCATRHIYNKQAAALAHLVRLRHGAAYQP